jgi:transcription antitermination factor NusG
VPENFIWELKQRIARVEASGGFQLDGLKQGDPVHITNGPFEGYDAVFDVCLSDSQRVQVLLEMLGRQVRLKIPVGAIEKRGSHGAPRP